VLRAMDTEDKTRDGQGDDHGDVESRGKDRKSGDAKGGKESRKGGKAERHQKGGGSSKNRDANPTAHRGKGEAADAAGSVEDDHKQETRRGRGGGDKANRDRKDATWKDAAPHEGGGGAKADGGGSGAASTPTGWMVSTIPEASPEEAARMVETMETMRMGRL